MKKILIVLMGVFLFAACSNTNDDVNSESSDNSNEVENSELENADDAQGEDHDESSNNEVDTNNNDDDLAVNNEHLQEFEEYDVLKEELDLDVYEGLVESDNKGTRIILFQTADGVKEYKSIFVK